MSAAYNLLNDFMIFLCVIFFENLFNGKWVYIALILGVFRLLSFVIVFFHINFKNCVGKKFVSSPLGPCLHKWWLASRGSPYWLINHCHKGVQPEAVCHKWWRGTLSLLHRALVCPGIIWGPLCGGKPPDTPGSRFWLSWVCISCAALYCSEPVTILYNFRDFVPIFAIRLYFF